MGYLLRFGTFILFVYFASASAIGREQLYFYSHPCDENFPMTVPLEAIYGSGIPSTFKLQLFQTKTVDFCDNNLNSSAFNTDEPAFCQFCYTTVTNAANSCHNLCCWASKL
jgi:hypothetical protein